MMLKTEVQKVYITFLSSKFSKWQRWDLNPSSADSKKVLSTTTLQADEAKRNDFGSTFFS